MEQAKAALESLRPGFRLMEWVIEPEFGRMSRGDEAVRIDPRNLQVLLVLALRWGEIVSQEELERTVWGDIVVTPNSLYQAVTQLRRALGDDRGQRRFIETIPRKGYRLLVQPEPLSESVSPPFIVSTVPTVSTARRDFRDRKSIYVAIAIAAGLVAIGLIAAVKSLIPLVGETKMARAKDGGQALIEQYEALLSEAARNGASARAAQYHLELMALYIDSGELEQARAHVDRALAIRLELSGENDYEVGRLFLGLTHIHLWHDDYGAAERTARKAVAILAATCPPTHPARIQSIFFLGRTLLSAGKVQEAAPYIENSIDTYRAIYGENHLMTWDVTGDLVDLRLAQARFDDAERLSRSILTNAIAEGGARDVTTGYDRAALARVLLAKGDAPGALTEAKIALEIFQETDSDNPFIAFACHLVGEALNDSGRPSDARDTFIRELSVLERTHASKWRVARATSALGGALLRLNQLDDAERHLRFASQALEGVSGLLPTQARERTANRLEELKRLRLRQTAGASQSSMAVNH